MNQKYWDAMLIRGWRKFQTIGEVEYVFISTFKVNPWDIGILRIPNKYVHKKTQVRSFTAGFLPKINDWLNDHSADKDIDLLKKLETSSYTAEDCRTKVNKGVAEYKKNRAIMELDTNLFRTRNHSTDWSVTK